MATKKKVADTTSVMPQPPRPSSVQATKPMRYSPVPRFGCPFCKAK